MKIKINEFNLEAASLVCPEEKKEFKEAFKWLQRSIWNLEAVENGRWAKGDMEAVITAETQKCSTEELKQIRIETLRSDKEKAARLSVKKFNKMNKVYGEKTGNFICEFVENRDLLMEKALIRLASV